MKDCAAIQADSQALLEPDPAEPDLAGLLPYRAPVTARQETLCKIFAEVLRAPRIGVDDDFFSLGGQSVGAMLIAGRIRAALGIGVSMADLFNAPTVAELDHRLATLAGTARHGSSG
jgi:aryl carrier-like protein